MSKTAESKPVDLGVKIGSPDEAYWTRLKENFEKRQTELKSELRFTEAIIEMVTQKAEAAKLPVDIAGVR